MGIKFTVTETSITNTEVGEIWQWSYNQISSKGQIIGSFNICFNFLLVYLPVMIKKLHLLDSLSVRVLEVI